MIENTLRYGQTSISVPDWATHIAWDGDGKVFFYEGEPYKQCGRWLPRCRPGGQLHLYFIGSRLTLPHPEPGPWYEQLYKLVED